MSNQLPIYIGSNTWYNNDVECDICHTDVTGGEITVEDDAGDVTYYCHRCAQEYMDSCIHYLKSWINSISKVDDTDFDEVKKQAAFISHYASVAKQLSEQLKEDK